jgi:hypothetical protein
MGTDELPWTGDAMESTVPPHDEAAAGIIFPFISEAGCRLLFHIHSERAKSLGLDDTALRPTNGSPIMSDKFETSSPTEFKVFSNTEREVR